MDRELHANKSREKAEITFYQKAPGGKTTGLWKTIDVWQQEGIDTTSFWLAVTSARTCQNGI